MTAAKKAVTTNFAADFKELEQLVEWFETQEVDLEEGLKKFERGLELAKQCRSRLKEVENKVAQIRAKFDGGAAEEPSNNSDQPHLL